MTRTEVRTLINRTIRKALKVVLEETLTVQDVARHYKCDERTLRRRRARGTLPPPDIAEGNLVRWLPETIQRFDHAKKQ